MKRRNFIKALCALPVLGWLPKSKALEPVKATVTRGAAQAVRDYTTTYVESGCMTINEARTMIYRIGNHGTTTQENL